MRIAWTVALVALIVGTGWLDYVTGPDFGFSLFYIVPIAVAGWRLGSVPATVAALVAGACWFGADFAWRQYDYLPLSLWNGTTRVVIYLFVGLATARLRRDKEEMAELLRREADLSRTDHLTGLLNGRGLRERLAVDLPRSIRAATPLTIAYLDLDDFKKINDVHGHVAGDTVLARVGGVLRENLRAGDLAARIGGDEFVIVMWGAMPPDAEAVVQRVLVGVREIGAGYADTSLGASAGIAPANGAGDVDELLRRADAAMYAAKAARKGTIQRA